MKKINNQWYTDKQYIGLLEEENEKLKNGKAQISLQNQLVKLQQRINKALEHIKQECFDGREYDTHGDHLSIQELLKILKGEE